MGKHTGFLEFKRQITPERTIQKRITDYHELYAPAHGDEQQIKRQGARCMDCGVPFCHSDKGCPINNLIPEWNDLVYQGHWQEALARLHKTNNFPEFTGRVCPAPCEAACVLGITDPAVSIKYIEKYIIDRGFAQGWIKPHPPIQRTDKRVAIIGSGPAGLAAADQLNQLGHHVVVYERADRIGGLLMYGIPNMKLDKALIDRRIQLLKDEGIVFTTNADIGRTQALSIERLQTDYDAVLLATGATRALDLDIDNRHLNNIHQAMAYLSESTMHLLNQHTHAAPAICAQDKDVIVIGGGDTGTDCIATAIRQGAKSITNFELMPLPPEKRGSDNPWPQWPRIYRVDYGHAEASAKWGHDPRHYTLMSKQFIAAQDGNVQGIRTVRVDWSEGLPKEVPHSEQIWPADLVLLAIGFAGPEPYTCQPLPIELDACSNYKAQHEIYQTSIARLFAAGDCRRGQSLVVWAIQEGRGAAREIDHFLQT